MIAEAAYYIAQKREFKGDRCLDDWLTAEQQVRQVISPVLSSEATMNDTTQQRPKVKPKTVLETTERPASDKTIDEQIGANMADRK